MLSDNSFWDKATPSEANTWKINVELTQTKESNYSSVMLGDVKLN